MYAVIETGGKQHRVSAGEVIKVEKLAAEPGASVAFERVLAVSSETGLKVGQPLVAGAKVTGVVVSQIRGPKVIIFRKKRTKQFRRTKGHRQYLTTVRIDKIQA